jgi:hypothetical protein
MHVVAGITPAELQTGRRLRLSGHILKLVYLD